VPFEIIRSDTHIDFIGKRQLAALISGGLIIASLIAIPIRGVNLGVDFAGGTEIQIQFGADAPAGEGTIRELVGAMGVQGASVVRYGEPDSGAFLIKFQGNINEAPEAEEGAEPELANASVAKNDVIVRIQKGLTDSIGPVSIERVDFVGPRVGEGLRRDGLYSLLLASFFIVIYIWFRFSLRFSPGAIAAVIHDLSITAGIFVILGMEFDLRILAAMLAILGYSLNDTIIIYDRIRENMGVRTTVDFPDVLNQSVNQTLSRTILTSGTTLAALLSLFFLGGEMIRPFAFAMIIGVFVGTYSSIFIAAPLLLILERRFGPAPAAKKA
jgi:preprotein translocase subunit SecF